MKVGLFVTCLVDLMRPSIGFASLKLLESAGFEVTVPANQTCCGQPGYNSGDRKAAQALAIKMLREFAGCDYVVVPSGSCGGMIRAHYPELLAEFPELTRDVEAIARRTYELTDFLVNVARIKQRTGAVQRVDHLSRFLFRAARMNVKTQPRALLSKVAGLSIREMQQPEQCCGFGGTFAVKYGEISARIADLKCEDVQSAQADALVLGDLGCMLNIEGRLRRRGDKNIRVLHVAEVLAGMTDPIQDLDRRTGD